MNLELLLISALINLILKKYHLALLIIIIYFLFKKNKNAELRKILLSLLKNNNLNISFIKKLEMTFLVKIEDIDSFINEKIKKSNFRIEKEFYRHLILLPSKRKLDLILNVYLKETNRNNVKLVNIFLLQSIIVLVTFLFFPYLENILIVLDIISLLMIVILLFYLYLPKKYSLIFNEFDYNFILFYLNLFVMTPYHALEEITKNKKKKNSFYQLFLDVNNVKISNWNLSYEQENIMTCIYKLIQLNNLYQDNELNDFYNKIISKHDQLYINLISVLYLITCLIIVIGGII